MGCDVEHDVAAETRWLICMLTVERCSGGEKRENETDEREAGIKYQGPLGRDESEGSIVDYGEKSPADAD